MTVTMTPERATRSHVKQKSLPDMDLTDTSIRWADHALARCQERNISPYEVVACIVDADYSTPDRNPSIRCYYRGDVKVIFNPTDRVVVTVMSVNGNHIPRLALTPTNPHPYPFIPPHTLGTAMPKKFDSGPAALLDHMRSLNPGDRFTRQDFLSKYAECGLSANVLSQALTQARVGKELLNTNDNPDIPKGTWEIPVQPTRAAAQPPQFIAPEEEATPVIDDKKNGNGVPPASALEVVEVTPLPNNVTKLDTTKKAKHEAKEEAPAAPGSYASLAQRKKAVNALMEQACALVEEHEGATWSTFGNPNEITYKFTWKPGN